jgi:drug/metabolite transporter (DMT)-like permease
MKLSGSYAGIAITFVGAILFSTKAILVKLAFREVKIDVISLLALRMLFSMPFFLIAAWWSSGEEEKPLSRQQWFYVISLGLMGYYVSSWFDFEGLQYISAGLERLILFLYPSFTALINYFFLKQALRKQQSWALLLTYIGITIAYYGELHLDAANPNFLLGSFLVFTCAITYAVYMAGTGRVMPKIGATRFTAYAMLAATVGVLLHFSFTNSLSGLTLKTGFWKYGILLAVFSTVLPSFLISAGMKRVGSNNAAIISSIGPVSTIVQAKIFLGEPLHGGQIIGTLLVITGVLLVGWKTEPQV